jgi:hypothetical protein
MQIMPACKASSTATRTVCAMRSAKSCRRLCNENYRLDACSVVHPRQPWTPSFLVTRIAVAALKSPHYLPMQAAASTREYNAYRLKQIDKNGGVMPEETAEYQCVSTQRISCTAAGPCSAASYRCTLHNTSPASPATSSDVRPAPTLTHHLLHIVPASRQSKLLQCQKPCSSTNHTFVLQPQSKPLTSCTPI